MMNKLKEEYNYWLNRNKKAEEYFTTHSTEQCMQHLELFNDIVRNLSRLMKELSIYIKLEKEEILYGF